MYNYFIFVFIKFKKFTSIFQFGCVIACFGLIFLNLFNDEFKKGPPEAVRIISSISLLLKFLVSSIIEKCSESTGTICVLYLLIGVLLSFKQEDIEIHNDSDGMPYVKIIKKDFKFKNLKISISHAGNYATATAILEL